MVYFFQNCDWLWAYLFFSHTIQYLTLMSLINFGGLISSKRKQFIKPDYLDQLKPGESECTVNPSN